MADLKDIVKLTMMLAEGYPNWKVTDFTNEVYFQDLRDIPSDLLELAAQYCRTSQARDQRFAPSAGEIRAAASVLHSKALGIPSALEAWQEVCNAPKPYPADYIIYRNGERIENPVYQWSHALVEKTARQFGWPDFPTFENESAERAQFFKQYENSMIYVKSWNTWLEWRDGRWQDDETGVALHLARNICKKASTEAQKRSDLGQKAQKIATVLSSRKMFTNVSGICQTDPRHAAIPAQFDADPWILNTPDGVVDLKTGDMRPARRDDYSRKTTAVSPGGACPVWQKFLHKATAGDVELMSYMQRVAGYFLSGSTAEQIFFFVYGTGGNGKGTFQHQIEWLMNSYWKKSNMETFTEQRFQKHAAEIAFFHGSRLVTASETEEGKRWNESRIKEMTGGDPITTEFKYGNPFTFIPSFKLFFTGNHKPMLRNVDEAIRRRLHMIPFTVEIPAKDRDKNLETKLRAEGSGILKWAIEGCLEWQKQGLNPPDRVLATTDEYFEDQDTIGNFIDEKCELHSSLWVPTSLLYSAYTNWARSSGEYALPRKRFIDQLAFRNLHSEKRGGNMAVPGIAVRQDVNNQDWRKDYE